MPEIIVRRAGSPDAGTLLRLIDALAVYEKLESPSEAAKSRLVEDGFGEKPRFESYLAERDGEAVGYAIVFETYSTFMARPTLYLEDIFIVPDARQQGAGLALFRFLAALAKERGCGRIEWTVLDWNELALGFYRRLGGRHMQEWLHYRLDSEGIALLAEASPTDRL